MNIEAENLDDDRERRAERRRRDEAELDRILGDRALLPVSQLQRLGGPSPPTIYRAARQGLIDLVRNGDRTFLTRGAAKNILLDGLGAVSFIYGKKRA